MLSAIYDRERRAPLVNTVFNSVNDLDPPKTGSDRAAPYFSLENTRLYGLWRAVQRTSSTPKQDDKAAP